MLMPKRPGTRSSKSILIISSSLRLPGLDFCEGDTGTGLGASGRCLCSAPNLARLSTSWREDASGACGSAGAIHGSEKMARGPPGPKLSIMVRHLPRQSRREGKTAALKREAPDARAVNAPFETTRSSSGAHAVFQGRSSLSHFDALYETLFLRLRPALWPQEFRTGRSSRWRALRCGSTPSSNVPRKSPSRPPYNGFCRLEKQASGACGWPARPRFGQWGAGGRWSCQ
eukprot:scaffold246_cov242-Pinguiococcus_pyrenoidosus.AAC.4